MVASRSLGIVFLALFLSAPTATAQTAVRVATWNIETVGVPGSLEYEAALDVLARVDADVIALNEIASAADVGNLETLATAAGYAFTACASGAPFGSDRNAILSRHPFASSVLEHDSASLSGDGAANDITRMILEAVIDLPGNARDLTVVAAHWKSGTGNDDEFRRVIESHRIGQAISDLGTAVDAYVVLGDVNEEIDSTPRTPNPMTALPSGLPASFSIGADLAAQLASGGFPNDPFASLQALPGVAATAVNALQLDGSDGTRPASGRRLDYVFVSQSLAGAGVAAEVYDSHDEGLAGGLAKTGLALPATTSLDASDHLLVFADLTVSDQGESIPALGFPGLLALVAVFVLGGALALQRATPTRATFSGRCGARPLRRHRGFVPDG